MLEPGSQLAARASWAGVTRVANVTGLDIIGIPVVAAMRPRSRSVTVSLGKGLTVETAIASTVHEACELHAAEDWHGEIRHAAHEDMAAGETDSLESMPRFAGGPECGALAEMVMPWVRGRRMASGAPVWYPLAAVGMNQSLPAPAGFCLFAGNATGLGASTSIEAASLHALCEVIERDAFAHWRLAEPDWHRASALDVDSVDDTDCRELIERIERAQLALLSFDITGDLGIPCFLAEIFDFGEAGRRVPYSQGLAASPDKNVALRQAILEAAQTRLGYISGARDDLDWYDYWPAAECVRESRRTFLQDFRPGRAFGRIESAGPHEMRSLSPLLEGDLSNAAVFRWAGPDLCGLNVVKVVVPGLRDGLAPDFVIPADPSRDSGRSRLHAWQ